jgi:hypothetical protein
VSPGIPDCDVPADRRQRMGESGGDAKASAGTEALARNYFRPPNRSE